MTGPAADQDRPEFEVRVDSQALERPVHRDVVEIDVHEEVNKHGRLTLLMQNWDQDTRTVRHSDSGPFKPGVGIAVLLGYHSDLTSVFDGVVTSLTTHFPRSGRPVLRVEARSRSVQLDFPPRSRQLADVSDADVATAIASDYSLTTDSEDGVTRTFVVQDRISDWEHLRSRASELGWVTYVRGTTLVFRAPAAADNPREYEYTRNLVELHLTQDIASAMDSVAGGGWDIDALEALESEVGGTQSGIDVGSRDDHATAASDSGWALRDHQHTSPAYGAADAVDAAAKGEQRRAALAHYTGTGVVIGEPSIRCDQWLSITGVGDRMSGPHYVAAVRHRLSATGYTTEFQVGVPRPLVPPTASSGSPAGLALGVVEALNDPESLNRVKVRLPWRNDGGEGVWARLATLDAGEESGTLFVPNVGQEVVVGYVDGNASVPVVLGSLHNGKQAPPEAIDAEKNALRAIITPGKHRFVLDDGDAAGITLETGKGHSMVISDSDSAITITHKDSGNAITISADGIELNAAQGDVKIISAAGAVKLDSVTLEGKASGPSKIESSATFDLKASGPLGLKGALVNIN